MHSVSRELMLIINLSNAAVAHKKLCDESCAVSLLQLRLAAEFIMEMCPIYDLMEAAKYIALMPVT